MCQSRRDVPGAKGWLLRLIDGQAFSAFKTIKCCFLKLVTHVKLLNVVWMTFLMGKMGEKRCVLQHQKITRRLLHPIDLVDVLGHLFGGLFTNEMGSFFQLVHAGFDSRNVS